jgi:glutaminyl-peptide cyclotransferase
MKPLLGFFLILLMAVITLATLASAIKPQEVWKTAKTAEIMETVRNIAVERIVDTEQHRTVEKYMKNYFQQYAPDWTFERDEFMDETPLGQKSFVNLIATLDAVPDATSEKYLILAAHYDSKMIEGENFEAATDSAVPCAILLQFARYFKTMAPHELLSGTHGHNWGIKLIFFDGEEAFHEWTPVDSIYGSRHLALDWATESSDLISKIELFVLLDLLGAPNMVPIPSRYKTTNRQFQFFLDAQSASQTTGKYVQTLRGFFFCLSFFMLLILRFAFSN